MEPVPQKHEWQIRQADVVSAPMTETQLRKHLVQLKSKQITLDQTWVRQGESEWVRAASIVEKLEQLDREGVYLQSTGDQGKQQTVGPFTQTRAYRLLRNKNLSNLEARIGRDSEWQSASQVLKYFESVLSKSEGQSTPELKPKSLASANSTKPPVKDKPTTKDKKPTEAKRLQACPHCDAKVNVARFAKGKTIACGSCAEQFKVGEEHASAAEPLRPIVVKAASSVPVMKAASAAIPLPDPGFDNVPLPPPASSSSQRSVASTVNPYSTPHQRPTYQQRHVQGASTAQYIVPGVFISLWAAFILVMSLLRVAGLIYVLTQLGVEQLDAFELGKSIGGLVVGLALSLCMLIGGINMLRQKGVNSARAAAVVAAIPCFGCFVFPLGIWACVTLFSKQAEADFR